MERLDVNRISENIDSAASYDISNNKVFGSAYYVYYDGVEIEKCYGTKSLHSDAPITNSTVFRLASMTKPITTIAALILVERGLLSLDDSVDKFLPEFRNIKIKDEQGNVSDPKKMPTVRNILSHSSGISSTAAKNSLMTKADKESLDASIAFYLEKGLDYEPGTKSLYSGIAAFDVLTKIIELVSNEDYLEFLKREIFAPCGMCDTTFIPAPTQQERMVEMHRRVDGENTHFTLSEGCIFEDYPYTRYLGGGGLVSTLSDYANFGKMLLNKGRTSTGRIVKEESVELLSTPQLSKKIMPRNARWGLGVRVITEDTYPYLPVGSFGWSGAYGSHFWIDPANKIVAVFMKNSKTDGGAGNESSKIFEKAVYSRSAIF